MPFGLTNAPAVFQSLINEVFQDILGKWVIAYIDDILVYSTSLEEHVCHVREDVITRQGVKMDVTKVQAVTGWPSLGTDVERYVQACLTCAQSWVSRQLPEGLLEPLPTLQCPWSHLSVDFLTDLPDSGGFTTVMVMVDRFSKGCKLIPLKGSPTAMQTAEAMFQHVFRNFGLPKDIVSDRGPQFTSRVWGSLCAQLGIGVSLSSPIQWSG
ncbi:hypothetical protein QTP86_012534 [Hemibagrus guttatus]|nr:hypothetical protein QTP86_012534 [Hemibagrus guttatus]